MRVMRDAGSKERHPGGWRNQGFGRVTEDLKPVNPERRLLIHRLALFCGLK